MATLQTVLGTIGDDTLTTDLIKDFVVDALDGDDTITIEETASGVEIQAGKGEDKVVLEGDISNSPKIKGGANADTLDFQGTVTSSSIYGGKAADSIKFSRTINSSFVSGDTGSDTITINNKVTNDSIIDGGEDDDLITINERISDSTVLGGGAQDTIDVNDNSDSAVIKLGAANDVLTARGKHGNSTFKGNGGDDTITVESTFTGSSNTFYGGKGEDNLVLETTTKVTLIGDKDADTLSVSADLNSEGASLRGGEGNDTVTAAASTTPETAKFVLYGDQGDDSLVGSAGLDTLYGGQGDDTLKAADGGSKNLYGDKGDDNITLSSADPSLVSGGDGADTITSSTIADANSKAHSIKGGDGIDSISVTGVQTGDLAAGYAEATYTTILQYAKLSEFISGNQVNDLINIANDTAVKAEISEKLKITINDDFSRVTTGGLETKRSTEREGLRLATAATVTSASSVRIDSAADDYIQAIDLSAGTTGNSTINASAANTRGMALIGGSGRDTILGGSKADAIIGNAGADSLEGGKGTDHLEGGAGIDTIKGGDDADVIDVSGTNEQVALDSIDGGGGSDKFNIDTAAAAVTAEFDMDNISNVLDFDTTAGNLATITFSEITETTGQTVDYTAGAEGVNIINSAASTTTKFSLTGGTGADTLKGSSAADTLIGAAGADSLFGGAGNDVFGFAADTELFSAVPAFVPEKVDGGDDTDTLLIQGAADAGFTLTAADDFTDKFVNMEVIKTVAKSEVISLTLHETFDTDTGILTIDLSDDDTAAGTNVVNVSAADGNFTITGSDGKDVITGGGGAEVIVSGAEDDTIVSGAGNDTITGGTGDDDITLTGGTDDVVFSAYATNGADIITSFTSTSDQLNISGAATYKRGATATTNIVTTQATGKIAITDNDFTVGQDLASSNGVLSVADQTEADWSNVGAKLLGSFTQNGTAANNNVVAFLIDNGTDTRIYHFADVNDGADFSDDFTLMATVEGIQVAGFANADFITG